MILPVPFYKQTNLLNCGPCALKMVLSYFGKNYNLKTLEKKTGIKKEKGISTIQIAAAASLLGYKTDFFSKHIFFNEKNLKLDFYNKYADIKLLRQSKKLIDNARKAGVNLKEKTIKFENLLSYVTKNSVPILLIDWNIIKNRKNKGYQGHFVPIIGYDKNNVYIHACGLNEYYKAFSVKKRVFDKARKAAGTDEDILVIYRKRI